jgi:hypothetical protein
MALLVGTALCALSGLGFHFWYLVCVESRAGLRSSMIPKITHLGDVCDLAF